MQFDNRGYLLEEADFTQRLNAMGHKLEDMELGPVTEALRGRPMETEGETREEVGAPPLHGL